MDEQDLSERMRKAAEAMDTNEDGTNKGVMNVYPNPPDRKPGTIDAKWGDRPPPTDQYGTATLREAHNDRRALLDRIFDSMPQATEAAKAEIRQNFEQVEYGSHSALLNKHAEARLDEHVPDTGSFTERVHRKVGF